MKRPFIAAVFLCMLLPALAYAASDLPGNVTTSVVFIANYNVDDELVGWGSGFFVDEGIIVTNKHVIQAGDWYRVYATSADGTRDAGCSKTITKSDVKINLDDDVAYMRVYLPCAHGMMRFAPDPWEGDPVSVIGYQYKVSFVDSIDVTVTSGSVIGKTADGWLRTDAFMDRGNSGGPVVNGTEVLGVAVAKNVDENGKYVNGYFIPSSVILDGLLYANDPRFGYTPQSSISSRRSSSRASSVSSQKSSFSSSRSSSRSFSSASARSSSAAQVFSDVSPAREGYAAILSLHDQGVIRGYADGTFRPDDGINRAEFLKILVAGFRSDAVNGQAYCFKDVAKQWFAAYVCAGKSLGWVAGYPDSTFRPEQPINRAEAMKILVEAFNAGATSSVSPMPSDVRTGTWFYEYVQAGVAAGLVDPRILFRADQNLTREEAAMWIEEAI